MLAALFVACPGLPLPPPGSGVFAGAGAASPVLPTTRDLLMRPLGKSGILVSEACLGGMTWGLADEKEASTQLSLAWDFGVNFFDTAESYPVPLTKETFGATDRAFAKWRKNAKMPRDRCVISTKVRAASRCSSRRALAGCPPKTTLEVG